MLNVKLLLITVFALFSFQPKKALRMEEKLFPEIESYVSIFSSDTASIPAERRKILREISRYTALRLAKGQPSQLTFICTHNSRRSHLSQIWTAVAAEHYGLGKSIASFSGGTEATAFNPRAVEVLRRAGLKLKVNAHSNNPRYSVRYSSNAKPLECFSKKYSDEFNPQSEFAAIMTCSQADKSCPIVSGSEMRIAIPYIDPKVSDGSPEETATYDERCKQIAQEMFYWVEKVKS